MVTARYLTVGLACALLYNAIVIVGDRIGLHYAWSLLISFVIVVVLGYRLHTGWTFPGAARDSTSFVRYTFLVSFNYPLMVAGLFVLVDLLRIPVAVAMPIVTVLLMALNFFGSRWALRARRLRNMKESALPGRLTTTAKLPCPEWLPRDEAIIERLGSHQSLYRFRKPGYQVQLLKDLAVLIPPGDCRVLDIGAGSGLVAEMMASMFPGKTVAAVDVTNRVLPTVRVPFQTFDGQRLPFESGSFDCALFCNVLHHVSLDQRVPLLREALRVTGGGPLVIKDHLASSELDHVRLAMLDFMGNVPFGGMVTARYLSGADWEKLLGDLRCRGERLPESPYRGGVFAAIFSNRLEICLRVTSDEQSASPEA